MVTAEVDLDLVDLDPVELAATETVGDGGSDGDGGDGGGDGGDGEAVDGGGGDYGCDGGSNAGAQKRPGSDDPGAGRPAKRVRFHAAVVSAPSPPLPPPPSPAGSACPAGAAYHYTGPSGPPGCSSTPGRSSPAHSPSP